MSRLLLPMPGQLRPQLPTYPLHVPASVPAWRHVVGCQLPGADPPLQRPHVHAEHLRGLAGRDVLRHGRARCRAMITAACSVSRLVTNADDCGRSNHPTGGTP